ncbi:MAG: hypothetical protein JO303_08825 [Caulobacteraceae bacterium]|nr:hypothetical protein [Caulobacteraceae bacterium]
MVVYGVPLPVGGFWLGVDRPPLWAVGSPTAVCHPGAGGSIGWADFEQDLAVAICHNRLIQTQEKLEDPAITSGW